MMVDWGASSVS